MSDQYDEYEDEFYERPELAAPDKDAEDDRPAAVRREARRRRAQSTKDAVAATSPKPTTKKRALEQDWGFEDEPETKLADWRLGLILVLVLLGGFGLVAWRKLDAIKQLAGVGTPEQSAENVTNENRNGESDKIPDAQPLLAELTLDAPAQPRPDGPKPSSLPDKPKPSGGSNADAFLASFDAENNKLPTNLASDSRTAGQQATSVPPPSDTPNWGESQAPQSDIAKLEFDFSPNKPPTDQALADKPKPPTTSSNPFEIAPPVDLGGGDLSMAENDVVEPLVNDLTRPAAKPAASATNSAKPATTSPFDLAGPAGSPTLPVQDLAPVDIGPTNDNASATANPFALPDAPTGLAQPKPVATNTSPLPDTSFDLPDLAVSPLEPAQTAGDSRTTPENTLTTSVDPWSPSAATPRSPNNELASAPNTTDASDPFALDLEPVALEPVTLEPATLDPPAATSPKNEPLANPFASDKTALVPKQPTSQQAPLVDLDPLPGITPSQPRQRTPQALSNTRPGTTPPTVTPNARWAPETNVTETPKRGVDPFAPVVSGPAQPARQTQQLPDFSQPSMPARPTMSNPQFDAPVTTLDPLGPAPLTNQPVIQTPKSGTGQPTRIDTAVDTKTYQVGDGESYWAISKQQYGTVRYFGALAEWNKKVVSDPRRLRPGMRIELPPADLLEPLVNNVAPTVTPRAVDPLTTLRPEAHTARRHQVRSGENYWSISKSQYGSSRYFAALAEWNKRTVPDPRQLRPGMTIELPPAADLESLVATASPDGPAPPASTDTGADGFFKTAKGEPRYRVGRNETLSDIAQRTLGRASRWPQIYHLNKSILPSANRLPVGSILALPNDALQMASRP